jgi:hypothetical protein
MEAAWLQLPGPLTDWRSARARPGKLSFSGFHMGA